MLLNNKPSSPSSTKFNNAIKPQNKPFFNKDSVGFLAKGAAGMGGFGYGLKKLNDINDHPNNISDFGHVGSVFGIGENDAGGSTAAVSTEAIAPTGGSSFPMLKDKSPLDKINFKERLKNLKLRRA